MRVFISADMEGICGISSMRQVSSNGPDHGYARFWMTEDVNAAVVGAVEAGAKEVVVRDAHGSGTNIVPHKLHPSARLVAGWTPIPDMLQGLNAGFGVAFFIGYHPGPPTTGGVLTHTYSVEAIREVRINGVTAGESLINTIQAGIHGVPVGLVTGERALKDEIHPVLEDIEFIETKIGFGYQCARLEPMEQCRREIRDAAARAVIRCIDQKGYRVYRPRVPIETRIEFYRAEATEACRLVPDVRIIESRTIQFESESAEEFIQRFFLIAQLLYGSRP